MLFTCLQWFCWLYTKTGPKTIKDLIMPLILTQHLHRFAVDMQNLSHCFFLAVSGKVPEPQKLGTLYGEVR